MHSKILFICAANVWRSQMAEWYYNFFTNSKLGSSAAIVEDRRVKYNHKPSQSIQDIMLEDGVDISQQRINLLTPDLCQEADKIVLLLALDNIKSEFKIHNQSPIDFLYENYNEKLIMYPVSDPYSADKEFNIFTRNLIREFVLSLV